MNRTSSNNIDFKHGGDDMKEEYDIIEIPGKHGTIHLHVPKQESTQEEIEQIYDDIAQVIIDSNKNKEPARK